MQLVLKDHVGKLRGTKAKEKKQRLRGEMKGADSAKGENKMHDGIMKFGRVWENKRLKS